MTYVETNDLNFKSIYKKDKKKLLVEHFLGDITSLKQFDKFQSLDTSLYKHSKTVFGKHTIDKWILRDNGSDIKSIRKIRTSVSFYKTKNTGLNANPIFDFITFEFVMKSQTDTLTYLTVAKQGLMDYSINQKKYHISYESILVGLDKVYLDTKNEIYELLKKD